MKNFLDYQNTLLALDAMMLHAFISQNYYLTLKQFCKLYSAHYTTVYGKRLTTDFAGIRVGNDWLIKNSPATAAAVKAEYIHHTDERFKV